MRGLLGGAAAGALSLVGARSVGAVVCRAPGDLGRGNANRCSGLCAKDASGRRVCQCQAPTVACGRLCVDPTTAFQGDPNNCDSCGHRCPIAPCQQATCTAGACGFAPNPATNGNACTTGETCQAGVCGGGTPVADGTTCSGGLCCGGTCVAGVECCSAADCPTGQVCLSNGTCAVPCPNGGTDCQNAGCGNRCIGTSDGNVCSLSNGSGGCNQSNSDCPVGRACSGAICEVVC